ncbi:MFS transporter [Salinibaculum salinum]|uniref:MFS transporter n=1 Tax=Salinibaculum salinum TaxID=3131996 RepID=UPI0030EDE144
MDSNEQSIVSLAMVGHALVHTYELSIPVLIPLWLDQFGITPSTMGIVVGVGYAMFGFGSIPAGILADFYESKKLIALCLFGMSVSFLAVSSAPTILVLALALFVWGVTASIYHPAGLSILSRDVTSRGRALGYHGIAGNIGVAIGPLVTILLLLVFDWRIATVGLALPGLLIAPLVWRMDITESTTTPGGTDESTVATDGGFSWRSFLVLTRTTFSGLFVVVFAIVIFEGLYYRGALTFLPDMLGGFATFGAIGFFGRPIEPSRYLYVGLLIVGIGGQYFGGWLSDQMKPVLGVALAFAALGLIALLFIPAASAGLVPLLLVSALLGFVVFGEQPLLQAAVAEHSTADTRGISYGYMYAGVFGVGAGGAAITGFLLTYASSDALFGFLALIATLATATAIAVHRYS